MNRKETISKLKQYFNVRELVCDHTYAKYGEGSWNFLDTAFLETLLYMRSELFRQPMVCNYKGHFQRGLRCNLCQLVKEKTAKSSVYISAHCLGKAGDFTVSNIPASKARDMLKENQGKLPHPIRIEDGVSWLHVDVRDQDNATGNIYIFRA